MSGYGNLNTLNEFITWSTWNYDGNISYQLIGFIDGIKTTIDIQDAPDNLTNIYFFVNDECPQDELDELLTSMGRESLYTYQDLVDMGIID